MLKDSLLSLLIWLPIFGGVLTLFLQNEKQANTVRWLAFTITLISLILCIPLYLNFNLKTASMQFVENIPWLTAYHLNYHLGVDGISMPMVVLTIFTTFVIILASWKTIDKKVSQYMAAFLIMQGMMVGMFCALDSILFYIFWEGILIPITLVIGVWGSSNRSYAAIKFFLYTFLGSSLFLIALLYLYIKSGSFYILDYYPLKLSLHEQVWIFFAFLVAFAVKVPMWPIHTWLPDAHTEAPAGGSVILAALMLKMGVYGFLRFTMPIVPDASQMLFWLMIILSLIAIIYIGFIAIAQTDVKRLIAYSSIAHMGLVTLGAFMIYKIIAVTGNIATASLSIEGAMIQMISHAFSTGAMFLGVGILYNKLHSRLINDFGGIAHKMPVFAVLFMLFALSNLGFPGTSGFVGEFLIILSAFKAGFWIAVFATTTLILSAAYTLWMYKRVFFGKVVHKSVEKVKDVQGFDLAALILLSGAILFVGIDPKPLLNIFHVTMNHLLQISMNSKI